MTLQRKIWDFLVDSIETIIIAVLVAAVVWIFLFRPFQVNGASMMPNLHNRQNVLTNLISLKFEDPKRGDVVVFQSKQEVGRDYIKRVIGLPGDTVQLQNGKIYLNGELLDETSYLDSSLLTPGGSFLKDGTTITVPENKYFVMGDNRTASSDSREWGFVDRNEIIGKTFFIYWPLTEMQLVGNPYQQ